MKIFLLFLIIMVVVIIYFLFKNDISQLKLNYITLIITLIGTFIGVYLAVFINDQQKIKDENDQIKNLVKLTTNDIDGIINYCNGINSDRMDTPIREPLMLEKLLTNDLYAKYCVIASTYLFHEINNIKTVLNTITDNRIPKENRLESFKYYIYELNQIKDLLDNSFNLNQKDFEELDKKWREKKQKVFNNIKNEGR
jgi:hypothetical protein